MSWKAISIDWTWRLPTLPEPEEELAAALNRAGFQEVVAVVPITVERSKPLQDYVQILVVGY